jgi:hypothetical protein
LKPIFQINGNDYTRYLADEGLKPSRNDLDSDGSGRNILDGLMYRSRIATKLKWTVSFNRMNAQTLKAIEADMYADDNYVSVTLLEAQTDRYVTRTYYASTINEGVQRYIGGETVYDGVTFNITER